MGTLLQALEIIYEVQRKRSNLKKNNKINKCFNVQNMFFFPFWTLNIYTNYIKKVCFVIFSH